MLVDDVPGGDVDHGHGRVSEHDGGQWRIAVSDRDLHQLLVCLAGSVVAEVADGTRTRSVRLDVPHVGLHIPPMVWGVQHHYTRDAVLMVLASAEYDAADYIRDFALFRSLRAAPR